MSKNGINIQVKLKTKHMFEFQMRHTYLCVQGIIGVCISLGTLVFLLLFHKHYDMLTNMVLALVALMYTVIYPFQMLQRSVQLVKLSPVLSKPLSYTFTSEGILVSQDNDDALLPWEDITKVVETRKLILVYSSPKNGYILPKAQYKEQYGDIKDMIKNSVNKQECKLQLREE